MTPERAARIGGICSVGAGYVERGPSGHHADSPLRILRARDLRPDGLVNWYELGLCEPVRDPERFLLQHLDVLLTTRTTQIRALVVQSPPANVLASAQFAILRPDSTQVDAQYMGWILDRASATGRLRSLIKGSTVQYLSPADLADLEVPLPSLERQRLIAKTAALRRAQGALVARLSELHDRLLDAALAAGFQREIQP